MEAHLLREDRAFRDYGKFKMCYYLKIQLEISYAQILVSKNRIYERFIILTPNIHLTLLSDEGGYICWLEPP